MLIPKRTANSKMSNNVSGKLKVTVCEARGLAPGDSTRTHTVPPRTTAHHRQTHARTHTNLTTSNAAPDTFCEMTLLDARGKASGKALKTDAVDKTRAPVWNETFDVTVESGATPALACEEAPGAQIAIPPFTLGHAWCTVPHLG